MSTATRSFHRLLIYGLLISSALVFVAPLWVMILTSLKDLNDLREGTLFSLPKKPSLEAFRIAWQGACTGIDCQGIQPYFSNSLLMVIPSVFLSTLFGALNGYVFSFFKFRGSELFFGALLLGCFIPFQVILLPMAQTLSLIGLSQSLAGLIFVHTVYGIAFTTLFFRNYYQSLPSELVKAARVDGASFFKIFYRIILPLSTPMIIVAIIWQFTQIWNDFLFGVVFSDKAHQPVTVALNNMVQSTTGVKMYHVEMAAALLAALPTLLVYLLAGRYFIRGLTQGAVKG